MIVVPFVWLGLMAVASMCALSEDARRESDRLVYEVPRLEGIALDGDPVDWGDRGFEVRHLANIKGERLPPEDLDVSFRLGWDDRGFLALVNVTDDRVMESAEGEDLWTHDGVEMVMATEPGSSEFYHIAIGPGIDPEHPKIRTAFIDRRTERRNNPLNVKVARQPSPIGYTMEVLLPWSNLEITPEWGREIGFQLLVTDRDYRADPFQALWYPSEDSHEDSAFLHRLRLSRRASPPVRAVARGGYERMRRLAVAVSGEVELVDQPVRVRGHSGLLAEGILAGAEAHSTVKFDLPLPPQGTASRFLSVEMGEDLIGVVPLPDLDEQRAREAVMVSMRFPSVFTGTGFPKIDFERPNYAEDLLGPYKIQTRFYDRDYCPVTYAEKPGRYGAVIDIIPESGPMLRRFRTLYSAPPEVNWWSFTPRATMELPRELGIDPGRVRGEKALGLHLKDRFVKGFQESSDAAAILAGLTEAGLGNEVTTRNTDALAVDRQWWVGLKRRLYGTAKIFPEPFLSPILIDGETAPVLREGTAVEAGMKADAEDVIDLALREWAADSDQGFNVLVARHGVIVLHRAYGERDGKPVTLDEPTWMASITKLLGGTVMMMLVDEGKVCLEDSVEKYLPMFKGGWKNRPLTLRDLFVHTNGLWDHWGDEMNDFGEMIAGYGPYLKVGEQHSYNGAGYALAGKVMEAVTGEALPRLYQQHLFEPLGMTHTEAVTMSWDAQSIPVDIAKVGQMLLNRGAYGNLRFFQEETFWQMLPAPIGHLLAGSNLEWGIGTTWFSEAGLGKGTFGHGAASGATLRIDPEHDLVIVMGRNAAGTNFDTYHRKFIEAVMGSLSA